METPCCAANKPGFLRHEQHQPLAPLTIITLPRCPDWATVAHPADKRQNNTESGFLPLVRETKHHHDNITSKSGTHKVDVRDEHFSIQGVLAAARRQLTGGSALGPLGPLGLLGHLGAWGWGGGERRGGHLTRGRAGGGPADRSEGRGGREGGGGVGCGEHRGPRGRGGRRESGGS